MNGERLEGSVTCPGLVIGGGYTVVASRDQDLDKLIPSHTFPSDPSTWTVFLVASANVQPFVLTVYASCVT